MITNSEPQPQLEEQPPVPAGQQCCYCHRLLDTLFVGAVWWRDRWWCLKCFCL